MIISRVIHPGITVAATIAASISLQQFNIAMADPNQDDQFLAVLQSKQIPALENVATVVAAGHTVCRELDDGMPAANILDGLKNDAYHMDPLLQNQPARVSATMSRFIAAAVEVYCPGDNNKIASLMSMSAGPPPRPAQLFAVAGYRTMTAPGPGSGRAAGTAAGLSLGTAATGDLSQPQPPVVPSPKAPKAKIPHTPRAVTKRPVPQRPPSPPRVQPPPPQQPPPVPQAEPPDTGPQPGGAAEGGGAGGGRGGNGPPEPPQVLPPEPPQVLPPEPPQVLPPEPPPSGPRPPGMIQLVPW